MVFSDIIGTYINYSIYDLLLAHLQPGVLFGTPLGGIIIGPHPMTIPLAANGKAFMYKF